MSHKPVGAGSSVAFTSGTATTSTAFSVQSSVIRVVAVGGGAHVSVGATPSASTTDYYVSSGSAETLALTKASNRVAGVTTGTTTIVNVPEGMQVPFNSITWTNSVNAHPTATINLVPTRTARRILPRTRVNAFWLDPYDKQFKNIFEGVVSARGHSRHYKLAPPKYQR